MRKEIVTGTDDYRKLIEDNAYYVDKTLLIEEFFKKKAEVTLITRPRRFGKTLNMTMMREFFDITKDSKDIFKDTKIMETEYAKKLNSVPVIYLTFKGCNGTDAEEMVESLKRIINSEYVKYYEIFKSTDKVPELILKNYIDNVKMLSEAEYEYKKIKKKLPFVLLDLTQIIYEYYKVKPIIILDEYDNPFIEAKNNVYYEEVNGLLSTLFVTTFKGNQYMDKAIMTGIQRIAHESIFSKFNNPSICTVTDKRYSDKFGLTEEETREYLKYFGYELDKELKEYYDGYKFFETEVYNPMSITKYISEEGLLDSYWVNTSANTLIKKEITFADEEFFEEFDTLLEEGTSEVTIDFATTFAEEQNTSTLWGLLVNAGYITVEDSIFLKTNGYATVRIPNLEVRREFQSIVEKRISVTGVNLNKMFKAMTDKDIDKFVETYKKIVTSATSNYDGVQKENLYHMLMLGMCVYLQPRYNVKSNLENGYGRADIIIEAQRENDMNVVIEFKYGTEDRKDEEKYLEKLASEALEQIHEKEYYNELKGDVLLLGIAHKGKKVKMLHEVLKK